MILLKPGARIRGIQPEMIFATMVVASVLRDYDRDCILTSATDGVHGHASRHYLRYAVDYRTKHLPRNELHQIVSVIKEALSADFDVILENEGEVNEHLHVEFDPKTA